MEGVGKLERYNHELWKGGNTWRGLLGSAGVGVAVRSFSEVRYSSSIGSEAECSCIDGSSGVSGVSELMVASKLGFLRSFCSKVWGLGNEMLRNGVLQAFVTVCGVTLTPTLLAALGDFNMRELSSGRSEWEYLHSVDSGMSYALISPFSCPLGVTFLRGVGVSTPFRGCKRRT